MPKTLPHATPKQLQDSTAPSRHHSRSAAASAGLLLMAGALLAACAAPAATTTAASTETPSSVASSAPTPTAVTPQPAAITGTPMAGPTPNAGCEAIVDYTGALPDLIRNGPTGTEAVKLPEYLAQAPESIRPTLALLGNKVTQAAGADIEAEQDQITAWVEKNCQNSY